jgi:SAM-dependent methyltransferase
VLDFGCGSGLFTRCLGDLLSEDQVVGSDFHQDAPAELKDRPYLANGELSNQPANFDLILAMHVIEHDDNPALILKELKSLGADDCTFVFDVPNVECVWGPVFGQAWDAWYLPFHRYHFSRKSLRGILEENGFVVVRQIDVTIPSMGRSIANLLGRRNTLPLLLLGALIHPVQWIAEKASRRPSALRVIAKART